MYQPFTLASLSGLLGFAQALNLNVASGGGNASSPLLYGLLFEVEYVFQFGCIFVTNSFQGCLSLRRWGIVQRDDPE
jgi:hypothetical protein